MSFLTVREVKTARSVAEAYGAICQIKIRQRDLHERVEGAVEIALDSAELSAWRLPYQAPDEKALPPEGQVQVQAD